ncbi:succinylglutamate desuccinylase/aspartoacylase family protein [Allomuricauda sp. SCSIO 65647]|uniref:succinylglutamate desuccinylase/aspartoacylase family protein n=1 Tax=Allomuricauda sp. SCSIO 65647 TaxID=2908843 RepID=UPI001F2A1F3D|nr:succinylglutamate desuccinylase/aspartoacylase family protein [Muricauda sp. SCSIO 65647]UJH68973.1 succinylglutamate desuccinylase/aspartoacylase family protein [Muricauda sp. SCSIO 65647]
MHSREENKTITVNGNTVKPGQSQLVRIEIARLPTGTLIDIPIHVFNGKQAGPTVLVQAGLHGDEINGVEALRRLLKDRALKIEKGALIVVPVLNIFGFIHFSRDVPDGKDVNRSFPGSSKGSLASRIAYHYTSEVLPQIDIAIDLHTGGAQRHNHPQVRYTSGDSKSEELAALFDAPFHFPSKLIRGSFRKVMHTMRKPVLIYEAGESMRFDEHSIKTAVTGIKNVLGHLGMISKGKRKPKSMHLKTTKWLRAPRAGMFIPEIENGSSVSKNQILGAINDTYSKTNKKIKAPSDGHIICINHQAVVNQGDALFHIGR